MLWAPIVFHLSELPVICFPQDSTIWHDIFIYFFGLLFSDVLASASQNFSQQPQGSHSSPVLHVQVTFFLNGGFLLSELSAEQKTSLTSLWQSTEGISLQDVYQSIIFLEGPIFNPPQTIAQAFIKKMYTLLLKQPWFCKLVDLTK